MPTKATKGNGTAETLEVVEPAEATETTEATKTTEAVASVEAAGTAEMAETAGETGATDQQDYRSLLISNAVDHLDAMRLTLGAFLARRLLLSNSEVLFEPAHPGEFIPCKHEYSDSEAVKFWKTIFIPLHELKKILLHAAGAREGRSPVHKRLDRAFAVVLLAPGRALELYELLKLPASSCGREIIGILYNVIIVVCRTILPMIEMRFGDLAAQAGAVGALEEAKADIKESGLILGCVTGYNFEKNHPALLTQDPERQYQLAKTSLPSSSQQAALAAQQSAGPLEPYADATRQMGDWIRRTVDRDGNLAELAQGFNDLARILEIGDEILARSRSDDGIMTKTHKVGKLAWGLYTKLPGIDLSKIVEGVCEWGKERLSSFLLKLSVDLEGPLKEKVAAIHRHEMKLGFRRGVSTDFLLPLSHWSQLRMLALGVFDFNFFAELLLGCDDASTSVNQLSIECEPVDPATWHEATSLITTYFYPSSENFYGKSENNHSEIEAQIACAKAGVLSYVNDKKEQSDYIEILDRASSILAGFRKERLSALAVFRSVTESVVRPEPPPLIGLKKLEREAAKILVRKQGYERDAPLELLRKMDINYAFGEWYLGEYGFQHLLLAILASKGDREINHGKKRVYTLIYLTLTELDITREELKRQVQQADDNAIKFCGRFYLKKLIGSLHTRKPELALSLAIQAALIVGIDFDIGCIKELLDTSTVPDEPDDFFAEKFAIIANVLKNVDPQQIASLLKFSIEGRPTAKSKIVLFLSFLKLPRSATFADLEAQLEAASTITHKNFLEDLQAFCHEAKKERNDAAAQAAGIFTAGLATADLETGKLIFCPANSNFIDVLREICVETKLPNKHGRALYGRALIHALRKETSPSARSYFALLGSNSSAVKGIHGCVYPTDKKLSDEDLITRYRSIDGLINLFKTFQTSWLSPDDTGSRQEVARLASSFLLLDEAYRSRGELLRGAVQKHLPESKWSLVHPAQKKSLWCQIRVDFQRDLTRRFKEMHGKEVSGSELERLKKCRKTLDKSRKSSDIIKAYKRLRGEAQINNASSESDEEELGEDTSSYSESDCSSSRFTL